VSNYHTEQEILKAWEPFYTEVSDNLSKELSKDWITLIFITTDGLWAKGIYYSEEEVTSALYLLLDILKKNKEASKLK
jgi:hypothetical protein